MITCAAGHEHVGLKCYQPPRSLALGINVVTLANLFLLCSSNTPCFGTGTCTRCNVQQGGSPFGGAAMSFDVMPDVSGGYVALIFKGLGIFCHCT